MFIKPNPVEQPAIMTLVRRHAVQDSLPPQKALAESAESTRSAMDANATVADAAPDEPEVMMMPLQAGMVVSDSHQMSMPFHQKRTQQCY